MPYTVWNPHSPYKSVWLGDASDGAVRSISRASQDDRPYDLTITSIILNRFNAFNAWGLPPGMMIISPSLRR